MEKIEDFGVHCKRYYSLEVSYFKSSLEKNIVNMLWNKYWVNALSSASTTAQSNHLADLTRDLAAKVENAAIGVSIQVCWFYVLLYAYDNLSYLLFLTHLDRSDEL